MTGEISATVPTPERTSKPFEPDQFGVGAPISLEIDGPDGTPQIRTGQVWAAAVRTQPGWAVIEGPDGNTLVKFAVRYKAPYFIPSDPQTAHSNR